MINEHVIQNIEKLSSSYKNEEPFPHIVIDNFFDERILNLSLRELKKFDNWHSDKTDYVSGYQVNKYYTPSAESDAHESLKILSQKSPVTMHILNILRKKETLDLLSKLTGIEDLLGDDDWLGGGVHKITNGGKLGIHADFNIHWKMNLHRRLNLLLYLNKEWKTEYNGQLELWEKDMSRCVKKIEPIFNRAVIFNITDDAFHGHPIPLNTPDDVARYSLALYYYSIDRPNEEKSPFHPVLWKDT